MFRLFIFSIITGIVLVAAGWGGYLLNDKLDNAGSLPARIMLKVEAYRNAILNSGEVENRRILTNKIILEVETVYLPLDAADFAGGIDDINGETILLTDRNGAMFHFRDLAFTQLDVAPPDNNIDALRESAANGAFGALEVRYKWFRYNDILHVSGDTHDLLYISYSHWNPDGVCVTSRLARVEVPLGSRPEDWRIAPTDWEVVLEALPCLTALEQEEPLKALEAGGRMVQESPTSLLWTTGAYERDDLLEPADHDLALAQADDSMHGRVFRVDMETGAHEELARGLRNPQGLTIDRDGNVWVTDHGMRGGDELNQVTEGSNFGWPAVTYGTHYDLRPATNAERHGGHDGYTLPTVAFVPSIAPGTALAIEGFHYTWDGDVLVGGLNQRLYRVHMGDRPGMFIEPIPFGERIRDMAMLKNSKIAVWTDDRQLSYLSVDEAPTPVETLRQAITDLAPAEELEDTLQTFNGCLQCHNLVGDHGAGPSLENVCNANVAGSDYAFYSDALQSLGGVWDTQRLADYIADPNAVAEGTSMAWGGASASVSTTIAGAFCALE